MSSFSLWSFGPVLLFLEGNVAHFVVLLSVLAWVAGGPGWWPNSCHGPVEYPCLFSSFVLRIGSPCLSTVEIDAFFCFFDK